MLTIIMWLTVFAVALAFLLKSSDFFIDAAESIGLALGMPRMIIGSLLLAFGTSLPELFTSVIAIYNPDPDASGIVIGNVVGSNIANILLVFGVMAIIAKDVSVKLKSVRVDLLVLSIATLLLAFFMWNYDINLMETLILAACYIGLLIYTIKATANNDDDEEEEVVKDASLKRWLILIAGAAGIYLGARYTVESIIELSALLNFGVDVVSLSAVALGTSLPELVVSVVAVRKGQTDMAIGNVVGSNVFNILGVVTIPSLLSLLAQDRGLLITHNLFALSVPVMILAATLLTVVLLSKRIKRWQGIVLIILYALYNVELFGNFIL